MLFGVSSTKLRQQPIWCGTIRAVLRYNRRPPQGKGQATGGLLGKIDSSEEQFGVRVRRKSAKALVFQRMGLFLSHLDDNIG
jgi:hypothetical protein